VQEALVSSFSTRFGARKGGTSLLVLFIPSVDRDSKPIDQEAWVAKALEFLRKTFGGGTAFPKARGVWRDDARGGDHVFDDTVVVQCYAPIAQIDAKVEELRQFLVTMGESTRQGAVGFVIDGEYLEIPFPTEPDA
jgi:hypothetical protein